MGKDRAELERAVRVMGFQLKPGPFQPKGVFDALKTYDRR